jgi:non-ribosomal peptide synthase protein (TIGR01720 family)
MHCNRRWQDGPLLRAGLFQLGAAGQRLLLLVHHLAVDAVSWRILLEDLGTAYRQALAAQPVQLPARSSAFQVWAARLTELARNGAWNPELAHWRQMAAQTGAATLCPHAGDGGDTMADAAQAQARLQPTLTAQLLGPARHAYRTEAGELMLTGLMRALRRWRGIGELAIELEGHGRETDLPGLEGLDLSRTVGWFTCLYPVQLELAPGNDLGADIRRVKNSLRAVPGKGLGWGALRYLAADPVIASAPAPQLVFNYLGQFHSSAAAGLRPATEFSGTAIAPANRRTHALLVTARVVDGAAVLDISYGRARFDATEMQDLADLLAQELQAVITHCLDPRNGGLAASDLDLLALSQDELDNIFD